MRATLLLIAALATGLLLAACGGSSGSKTESVGGATVTVPADVQGVYPELETLLAQFPYQGWYTKCVITRVKNELSPSEVEALEGKPESSGAGKAEEIIAAAGATCKKTKRPLIDPNASEKELALFRAGFVEPLKEEAEKHGFEGAQIECVEQTVEELPVGKVVGLGNGTDAVRKGILLSVLAQCVKPE